MGIMAAIMEAVMEATMEVVMEAVMEEDTTTTRAILTEATQITDTTSPRTTLEATDTDIQRVTTDMITVMKVMGATVTATTNFLSTTLQLLFIVFFTVHLMTLSSPPPRLKLSPMSSSVTEFSACKYVHFTMKCISANKVCPLLFKVRSSNAAKDY